MFVGRIGVGLDLWDKVLSNFIRIVEGMEFRRVRLRGGSVVGLGSWERWSVVESRIGRRKY